MRERGGDLMSRTIDPFGLFIVRCGSRVGAISVVIIHQFFNSHDWSKRFTRVIMPELKLGNIRAIFPNFKTARVVKNNKHRSLHLARNYARMFVHGHYLFREVNSFSRDKYPSIFSHQMEAIVFIILQIFFFLNTRSFENWGISLG